MLGLLLLYWIGKYFYKLAEKFEKSKWVFTILGIAIYYVGTFIFAAIFIIVGELYSPGFVDDFNETLLSFISLPFGLLSCFILYKYLKKKWEKSIPKIDDAIAEIGKISQ